MEEKKVVTLEALKTAVDKIKEDFPTKTAVTEALSTPPARMSWNCSRIPLRLSRARNRPNKMEENHHA